ncbi:hypothetical protein ACK6U2_24515, partial [Citrobacter braakii]|uniref:hypothetical protein n=1 Tax=Citrobacter braakii TaxID=57706 RepID=UPI003C2FB225
TDGDGSHGSTSKTPSYTKSVSWQHHPHLVAIECSENGISSGCAEFGILHYFHWDRFTFWILRSTKM